MLCLLFLLSAAQGYFGLKKQIENQVEARFLNFWNNSKPFQLSVGGAASMVAPK